MRIGIILYLMSLASCSPGCRWWVIARRSRRRGPAPTAAAVAAAVGRPLQPARAAQLVWPYPACPRPLRQRSIRLSQRTGVTLRYTCLYTFSSFSSVSPFLLIILSVFLLHIPLLPLHFSISFYFLIPFYANALCSNFLTFHCLFSPILPPFIRFFHSHAFLTFLITVLRHYGCSVHLFQFQRLLQSIQPQHNVTLELNAILG